MHAHSFLPWSYLCCLNPGILSHKWFPTVTSEAFLTCLLLFFCWVLLLSGVQFHLSGLFDLSQLDLLLSFCRGHLPTFVVMTEIMLRWVAVISRTNLLFFFFFSTRNEGRNATPCQNSDWWSKFKYWDITKCPIHEVGLDFFYPPPPSDFETFQL